MLCGVVTFVSLCEGLDGYDAPVRDNTVWLSCYVREGEGEGWL